MNNCQKHLVYGTMGFSGVDARGLNVTLGHLDRRTDFVNSAAAR